MPATVKRGFLGSLLKLTRTWNLLIIAGAQLFTAAFLIGAETLSDIRIYLLAVSTTLIAAGGYIINDYYDIKIDYINKPERVVVGKGITRRFALLFHTLFSVMGIAIGTWLSWRVGVLNMLCAFLLWWYSNSLKRWAFVGNFAVALLTGLSIWAVALLFRQMPRVVFAYAILAFFITLIREIIKDMEDVRGDNTFGCMTLPVVWGMRGTKVFLYVLVVVFAATVGGLNHSWIHLPWMYFLIMLYIPLGAFLYLLFRADTIREFGVLSLFCKLIMLLGIGSMLLV